MLGLGKRRGSAWRRGVGFWRWHSLGGFYVDYGNDDYWDPAADPFSTSSAKLGWWTINLSKFVCPSAPGTLNPETGAPYADCSLPNARPGY